MFFAKRYIIFELVKFIRILFYILIDDDLGGVTGSSNAMDQKCSDSVGTTITRLVLVKTSDFVDFVKPVWILYVLKIR